MRRRGWCWVAAGTVVVVVAVGLRLWMPGPTMLTVDESNWLSRSDTFHNALARGDFAATVTAKEGKAATRPGVVTMWIGGVAVELADRTGGQPLRYGHQLMALFCGLLLAPFMAAARRLVGTRAALVAGGVVAVEPLMVGHSAILHTDAPLTMLFAVAVVGLLAAIEVRREESDDGWTGSWWKRRSLWWSVLAGATAGGAALTKLTAEVLLVPMVVAVAGVHLWVRRRTRIQRAARPRRSLADRSHPVRELAGVFAPFAVAALGTVVVSWPALWVDPASALRATIDTAELADLPRPRLFLGEVVEGPDWRYYFVEVYYRTSPWLAVASLLMVVAAVARRGRGAPPLLARRHATVLATTAVVYLAVLITSQKQYARYLLPLLPIGALVVGAAAARWWERAGPRIGGVVAAAVLVASAAWTGSLAPYAISHVDPLVGGQSAAVEHIPLGWDEGKERIGTIHALPQPCPTWAGTGSWVDIRARGCEAVGYGWLIGKARTPRMVLRYVYTMQNGREPPGLERYLRRHGRLVYRLEIQGLDYAQVWFLDEVEGVTG